MLNYGSYACQYSCLYPYAVQIPMLVDIHSFCIFVHMYTRVFYVFIGFIVVYLMHLLVFAGTRILCIHASTCMHFL